MEGSVSPTELQKTTTKVMVRLANVDLREPYFLLTGARVGADSIAEILGSDMSPLSYSKTDEDGTYFLRENIDEFVQKPTMVSRTVITFRGSASMDPLYETLAIEGSTGVVGTTLTAASYTCSLGDCNTTLTNFGDWRTHIGGHLLT